MTRTKTLLCAGLRDRLRRTRKAQELSIAGLAEKAGLAHTTIRNIEEGRRMPGVDTVEMLARALGVDPRWLAYDGTPEP